MLTWGGHTTYEAQEGPEGTQLERPGRALVFCQEDAVKGRPCIVRWGVLYVLGTSTLCHSWPHVYLDLNSGGSDMNVESGGWQGCGERRKWDSRTR